MAATVDHFLGERLRRIFSSFEFLSGHPSPSLEYFHFVMLCYTYTWWTMSGDSVDFRGYLI